MNNIKKAFKDKSRLRCMADGGFVKDENRSVPRLATEKEPEIFRSEVGGVPTFTDQYARRPGAVPYTPGQGAQNVPANTVTNNVTNATRTYGQNSFGMPVAQAPAMENTGRELLGMAKQVPVFGPMVAAADAAASALRQSPYEKMNGLAAGSRSTPESNVPSWVRGPMSGGLRPGGLDPSIIANAAKFDQPADTRPMWQRAPKMDISMTSPVANGQFGNVGQPQTAPAPMWQRQPMQDVGMDYVAKTGGYGPTKKPEPVAQMADGGRVPPAGYYDISSSAGRKEFEAAYRRGEKPQVWIPPKSDFKQAMEDRFINRMTQSIGVPLVIDALVGKDNDAIMQRREALKTAAKTTAAQNAGQLALRAVAPRLAPLAGPVGAAAALSYQINQELKPGGALRRPEQPVSVYFPDTGQRFPPRGGPVRGPGGPTDDKVPAMLSDGEYVLPADTVEAIGVDKLDAIKDATHEPTGKAKYRQGLRKFGDGGLSMAGDVAEDVLGPDIYKRATTNGQLARGATTAAGRGALNLASKATAIAAPIMATHSAVTDSLADRASGYEDAGSGDGGFMGHAGRVATNVGNALTGGYAEKLAQGLTHAATGEGFTAGWNLPNRRDEFLGLRNQQAYDDQKLRDSVAAMPEPAKLSVAPTQQAAAPVGQTRSAELNEIQREALGAARSQLRNRGGGGYYAQVPRNEREINARYDKLAQELRGMYSSKGQGNLARKLLELEAARGRELGFDQRGAIDVAGMNSGANTAANAQRNQARIAAANDLSALGNTQAMNASNALLSQSRVDAANIAAAASERNKLLSETAKAQRLAAKEGEARFDRSVERMFAGSEDPEAARDDFRNFVAATNPKYLQEYAGVKSLNDIYSLPAAEQNQALSRLREMIQMRDVANRYAGDRGASVGYDAIADGPRDADIGDAAIAGGNLSFWDYAKPNLINMIPFNGDPADEQVVPLASGVVVPYRELVGQGGKLSADRLKMVHDARKVADARRSKLREGR